ncbi:hypothetical protein [Robiginitalea sp. SC105]|uniref:hypothetical protein n=1 Tax=Robiginitalea sp. SC105 TaxID=2762332 RepID=UPI00163951ED|nr:hypothetical protein [Robiginitalea sp. SC105]MBC2840079.1 hypothetical protein [Robiginitalea sp. SC105]
MLRFFRQIRQRLLTDNKFSKYLLYAIGEILLVVIGILIALQVNTYQENKMARSKECEYLSSLLADLTTEKNFLETYAGFDKDVIFNAEALLQAYYDRGAISVDEAFSRQLSILNNRSTFRKHNSTYMELLSTGELNLLTDQKLKQSIMLYFQTVEQYETIIRQNNEYIDNHFAPLALQVSTHYVPNAQIKWSKNILEKGYIKEKFNRPPEFESDYFDYVAKRLNHPLEELELVNQIHYRYRISMVHLSLADDLLETNKGLLNRIEEVIDSCSS